MENIIDNLKKSRNCKEKQYYLQELVHFANRSKKNMKSLMEYEGISVILEKAIKACKQEGGGGSISALQMTRNKRIQPYLVNEQPQSGEASSPQPPPHPPPPSRKKKSSHRGPSKAPSPPNMFESLDDDVLIEILSDLDNKTIIKFAATNKKLKQKVIDLLLNYRETQINTKTIKSVKSIFDYIDLTKSFKYLIPEDTQKNIDDLLKLKVEQFLLTRENNLNHPEEYQNNHNHAIEFSNRFIKLRISKTGRRWWSAQTFFYRGVEIYKACFISYNLIKVIHRYLPDYLPDYSIRPGPRKPIFRYFIINIETQDLFIYNLREHAFTRDLDYLDFERDCEHGIITSSSGRYNSNLCTSSVAVDIAMDIEIL